MNKITISDIDNSIDDIYNTQINITIDKCKAVYRFCYYNRPI